MTTLSEPGRRITRRRVYLMDRGAELVISGGGLIVLAAVLGICVYLVWVTAPLFKGGRASIAGSARVQLNEAPILATLDEYHNALTLVDRSGSIGAFMLADGRALKPGESAAASNPISAWSRTPEGDLAVLGREDGSIQIMQQSFVSRLLTDAQTTPAMGELSVGQTLRIAVQQQADGTPDLAGEDSGAWGFVSRTDRGDLRLTAPWTVLSTPVAMRDGDGAIERLDVSRSADGRRFIIAIRADGTGVFNLASIRPSLSGGPPRTRLSSRPITWQWGERTMPDWVFATGDGQSVIVLWQDGQAQRYGALDPGDRRSAFELVESFRALEPGNSITAAHKLAGSQTVLVGDDSGTVHSFFVVRDPASTTPDGSRIQRSASFRVGSAPIVLLTSSGRGRTFAAADRSGRVALFHATSHKRLATLELEHEPVVLEISPKADAVLAMGTDGGYRLWGFDPGYPTASFSSLFLPVLYEGKAQREFVYQSSSGDDAAEIKLSLVPLIFGTLKATIWAMLFATPIAVLGAIYTSEFLRPRVKNIVKPTIEMMASLPSVVLGFIAAMVVAPFVHDWLPTILLGLGLTPLAVMVAALVWDLRPGARSRPISPGGRLVAIGLSACVGLGVAVLVAPGVERALFQPSRSDVLVLAGSHEPVAEDAIPAWVGSRDTVTPHESRLLRAQGLAFRDGRVVEPVEPGDEAAASVLRTTVESYHLDDANLIAWLDGTIGGPWPGWLLALMLPAFALVWIARVRLVDRRFIAWSARVDPSLEAIATLGRFALTLTAGVAIAGGLAWVLSAGGLDARDSLFGPYSPRNTLIVGLIMGFAIVPIIYTISEDAMRAVPNALRLASLGAGATPWQTAVRIVLPVAGSGIFSACMIGLGRGVGETMIVLMATGNTPEMSWNLFAGFRTLAANIAVELPEAPQGSAHYRVLFLCGLVLFVMTFVINTLAELVRQRFRKRTAGL